MFRECIQSNAVVVRSQIFIKDLQFPWMVKKSIERLYKLKET